MLWVQVCTFLVALSLAFLFVQDRLIMDRAGNTFLEYINDFYFTENHSWIDTCFLNIRWGADLTALILILLVSGTFPFVTLFILKDEALHPHLQAALFLAFEGSLLASLCSLNVLLMFLFVEFSSFLYLLAIPDLTFSHFKGRAISSIVLLTLILQKTFDVGSFALSDFKIPSSYSQIVFLLALVLRRSPWQGLPPSSPMSRFMEWGPLFIGDMFLCFRLLKSALNPLSLLVLSAFLAFTWTHLFRKRNFLLSISHVTMCLIYFDLAFLKEEAVSFLASLCFLTNYVLGCTALLCLSDRSIFKTQTFFYLSLKTFPFSLGFVGHVITLQALRAQNDLSLALAYLGMVLVLMIIPFREPERQ